MYLTFLQIYFIFWQRSFVFWQISCMFWYSESQFLIWCKVQKYSPLAICCYLLLLFTNVSLPWVQCKTPQENLFSGTMNTKYISQVLFQSKIWQLLFELSGQSIIWQTHLKVIREDIRRTYFRAFQKYLYVLW